MRIRLVPVLIAILVCLSVLSLVGVRLAQADSPQFNRTFSVQFTYVKADSYKNRLVNAKAAFDELQKFFQTVKMKPGYSYSFLRDVMRGSLLPDEGYVMSPLGYGFGACGASSLLNKLVQTATFRDADGKEKPVFQTIMVWTWNGDRTYEKYGATIYLDPEGAHTRDYIWKVNPAYTGPSPEVTIDFDLANETVKMTMNYADKPMPEVKKDVPTAAPTQAAPAPVTVKPVVKDEPPVVVNATPIPPTPAPEVAMADKPDKDEPDTSDLKPADKSALLAKQLKDIIRERKLGVWVQPIGDAALSMDEVGVNQDTQLFVASAFKGPVALYFFENISKDVWGSVPQQYWLAKDADKVPAEYREAWTQHHDILKDVYMMTVYSENDGTGNVLMYVYQNSDWRSKADNPITAYNNWSHQVVGVSLESGMRSWESGKSFCRTCYDERYGKKSFQYGTRILIPNNSYSARDLAKYYVYMATKARELGYYDAVNALLSVPTEDKSFFEYFSQKYGMQAASKDGWIGKESEYSDGFYITTDAGLLTLADGTQYAVAFMAFDSGDLLSQIIGTTFKTIARNARPTITVQTTTAQ
ncbi:MAG: hypothetical protein IT324_28620 [Anaerolineae bacterium]|nr:hypothetical protein [Anaerolineae bacterium]